VKIALLLIGFVGAGVIGAVAARELFPADAPEVGAPPGIAAIEARVNDLSAQVTRLTEEVRAQRDARILPDAPPPATVDAPAAIEGEAAAAGVPGLPAEITDDLIEKKVVETVEKMARARAAEKARRDEAAVRKKEREWLLAKQKELGLTDYQVNEFAKMLISRRQRMGEMKRRWNAAPEEQKPQVRAEMEDYSRTLRGELQKLLNADQYDAIMNPKKKR